MPFIQVKTNTAISSETETALKADLGQAISLLPGKSENWLMIDFAPEAHLWFRGTDAPAVIAEVSVVGSFSGGDYQKLTAELCRIFSSRLPVPSDRIYVKYSEVPFWGWNGSNF